MTTRGLRVVLGAGVAVLMACDNEGPRSHDAGEPDSGPRVDAGSSTSDAARDDGGGGDAGPAPLDCTGTFGAPEPILDDPASSNVPAITGDELELFYVHWDAPREIVHSTRATRDVVFPAGEVLTDLSAFCPVVDPPEGPWLDVSADGLRLYFTCGTGSPAPRLFIAERVTRDGPFGVPVEIGSVWRSISLSPDERTLYGNGQLDMRNAPMQAVRAARSDPFPIEAYAAVPFEMPVALTAPDVSPDGLSIIGTSAELVAYVRPTVGAPFGSTPTVLPIPGASRPTHAEHAHDCRSLYVARFPGASGEIVVMRR